MIEFNKSELYELKQIIKIADAYDLVNHITVQKLLEKIELLEET